MPSHHETLISPYSPEQLFALVADVEHYPEFLPWCRAARILERGEDYLIAELVIHFKQITQQYTSHVSLKHPHAIDVEMTEGPFDHLTNQWHFEAQKDGQTKIILDLDFSFKHRWMEKLIGTVFTRATEKMVAAFSTRADDLYGSG